MNNNESSQFGECIRRLFVLALVALGVSASNGQTIYEAESAVLSGPVSASDNTGFTGSGYADFPNATGAYAEFSLIANSAGTYPIAFRYGNGDAVGTDRPLQLKINGTTVISSLSFPGTGSWTSWRYTATNTVMLNAGLNTIRITSTAATGPNVDHLLVTVNGTQVTPPGCSITWNDTQQRIDGFGFSSAWCGTLSAAKNNALYGTIGMSLLRIRIDENNNWGSETANSAAAHSYGAQVFGCPWRAPAYMTYTVTNITSTATNRFIYLSTNYFNAFALWLNQAANSHNLDYVSVKNEPDMYMSSDLNMSPEEIRIFCASNAPAIGRPVTMADAVGFTDSVSDPTLNDPVAVNNIAIVSGHFYGGGNRVHSNALAKGKPVWMTEHYLDGCATNFAICLNLAKEINDALKNQFSAYVGWWAQDGDPNINFANSSGTILKDGYTMGQFAKFIRPGYYRVGTTSVGGGAEITAFKDAVSSNYVVVAINRGSTVITQQFNLYGFPASTTVTPWLTSYTQSLAPQASIAITNQSFSYVIQPSNIVTFVGTPPMPPLAHRYTFSETNGTMVGDVVGGPTWTGALPKGGTFSGGGQLGLAAGSSQYVRLPPGIVGALSNMTIMAWVNLSSKSNWARLFDFGSSTTNYMFVAPQNSVNGTLRFAITTNSSAGEQQITCNATLATNTWQQVAVTLNGGTGILYLNGVPVGTNSAMTLKPMNLGNTVNNYIGKSQWSDPYLNGSVDEFRIYNAALSAVDIAAAYTQGASQLVSMNSPATVTLGNLSQTYNGAGKAATYSTVPNGLNVSLAYNGSVNPPTNAGNYTVVGTVNDFNYVGAATNTLVINKAGATVVLGSLTQSYSGNACAATAATSPAGLMVNLSYNGNNYAPTNPGSYTVIAQVSDVNYQGGATNTLVIQSVLPDPTLGITVTNGTVTLIWPAAYSNYTLQSIEGLGTGLWNSNLGQPFFDGTNYQITLPATNSQQFYRLSQ